MLRQELIIENDVTVGMRILGNSQEAGAAEGRLHRLLLALGYMHCVSLATTRKRTCYVVALHKPLGSGATADLLTLLNGN